MDIKKADSKGRIIVGNPDTHYFVTGPSAEGAYRLQPVPRVESLPEGYEYAEVSAAKEAVTDLVSDCIYHWLWYAGVEYPENVESENGQDAITVADAIVERLIQGGVKIPEDFQ